MALNLAPLNVKGLKESSKCACLLSELSKLSVNVVAVQETHFTCAADCQVLEDDYVVLSAYGSCSSVGVSVLNGLSLNADVNLILADDGDRLIEADVAVKSFEFWVGAVYTPNITAVEVYFFSAVSTVPRRSETDSFSGWLECSPSLASYWKFHTSLLEMQDFRDWLESLVQWALVENKKWGSLKHRIRDFAIKYSRQLNLDRTKMAKSLEDKLSHVVEVEDSLAIDSAR